MWSEIPIAFWRLSSRKDHHRHLALHQSHDFMCIPPAGCVQRNPQTGIWSSLDQLIGDQVNDPRLGIGRQPVFIGNVVLEKIKDHILSVRRIDGCPFQRKARKVIFNRRLVHYFKFLKGISCRP